MGLLITIFLVTLGLTAASYLAAQSYMAKRETAEVRERLAGVQPAAGGPKAAESAQLFSGEGAAQGSTLRTVLGWFNVDGRLQKLTARAGVEWAPGQVVFASLALGLAAFNLSWYVAPPQISRIVAAASLSSMALPVLYLRRKGRKRTEKFEEQFPDALLFVARAMRAGHAFSVSLDMLQKEFEEPLAGEYRIVYEEQNLGLPIDVALEKLATRMPLLDVRFFVAAVVLQKRTGGNLGEILEKLASLIRERFKLRGQIRTISAHGRLSSGVLTAIPAVVAVMMYFVNPEHMRFFVDEEMGRWMAGLAIGFAVLGYFVMRQIVKIEV